MGLSRKLQDKSDGPYLITELGPNHTYRLVNCKTNKPLKSLINAQHLRLYCDPRPYRRQTEEVPQLENEDNPRPYRRQTEEVPQLVNEDNGVNRQVPEINDNVHKEATLQPQSDEDERINQPMYDVERFLGKKTIKGHVHYKCKWSDGSPSSWEPAENITEKFIEEYHMRYTQGKRRKHKRKQGYRYLQQTQEH